MKMSALRLCSLAAICASGVHANLVVNGDFSSGNASFTSDYNFVAPAPNALLPAGVYTITPNMRTPIILHNFATGYFDHTSGDANGLFMAVNGSTVSNQIVWEQTIPVVLPNTNYLFSAWVSSWVAAAPAQLQFSVNGVLLDAPFSAPSIVATWQVFEAVWNSGPSTSATISVVNLTTALGGNDFALDDIAFDQPIPEPATGLTLLSAAGCLIVLRNRYHRRGRRASCFLK